MENVKYRYFEPGQVGYLWQQKKQTVNAKTYSCGHDENINALEGHVGIKVFASVWLWLQCGCIYFEVIFLK